MTTFPDGIDQLAALGSLHSLLTAADVPYWLFGGWAVDFHVGRVTRWHQDLDVAVWATDRARVAALLAGTGWTRVREDEDNGYAVYRRGSVELEVAFLARDEHGVVYTPLREGRGDWPAGGFGDEVLALAGAQARVLGRAALVADKSVVRGDAASAARDRADVASLEGAR